VTAWFADTGAGIDAENLQKIFDPFFTTSPWARPAWGSPCRFGIYRGPWSGPSPPKIRSARLLTKSGAASYQGAGRGQGTVFMVDLPLDLEETLESEPSSQRNDVNGRTSSY
jgi:hypothetical protein